MHWVRPMEAAKGVEEGVAGSARSVKNRIELYGVDKPQSVGRWGCSGIERSWRTKSLAVIETRYVRMAEMEAREMAALWGLRAPSVPEQGRPFAEI